MLWAIRQLIGFGLPSGIARAIAFGGLFLLIAGAITLTVRSCDRKDALLVETAVEKGRTDERAAVNQGVIVDVEKAHRADTVRDPDRDERLRDKYCRDCGPDGQ